MEVPLKLFNQESREDEKAMTHQNQVWVGLNRHKIRCCRSEIAQQAGRQYSSQRTQSEDLETFTGSRQAGNGRIGLICPLQVAGGGLAGHLQGHWSYWKEKKRADQIRKRPIWPEEKNSPEKQARNAGRRRKWRWRWRWRWRVEARVWWDLLITWVRILRWIHLLSQQYINNSNNGNFTVKPLFKTIIVEALGWVGLSGFGTTWCFSKFSSSHGISFMLVLWERTN